MSALDAVLEDDDALNSLLDSWEEPAPAAESQLSITAHNLTDGVLLVNQSIPSCLPSIPATPANLPTLLAASLNALLRHSSSLSANASLRQDAERIAATARAELAAERASASSSIARAEARASAAERSEQAAIKEAAEAKKLASRAEAAAKDARARAARADATAARASADARDARAARDALQKRLHTALSAPRRRAPAVKVRVDPEYLVRDAEELDNNNDGDMNAAEKQDLMRTDTLAEEVHEAKETIAGVQRELFEIVNAIGLEAAAEESAPLIHEKRLKLPYEMVREDVESAIVERFNVLRKVLRVDVPRTVGAVDVVVEKHEPRAEEQDDENRSSSRNEQTAAALSSEYHEEHILDKEISVEKATESSFNGAEDETIGTEKNCAVEEQTIQHDVPTMIVSDADFTPLSNCSVEQKIGETVQDRFSPNSSSVERPSSGSHSPLTAPGDDDVSCITDIDRGRSDFTKENKFTFDIPPQSPLKTDMASGTSTEASPQQMGRHEGSLSPRQDRITKTTLQSPGSKEDLNSSPLVSSTRR